MPDANNQGVQVHYQVEETALVWSHGFATFDPKPPSEADQAPDRLTPPALAPPIAI